MILCPPHFKKWGGQVPPPPLSDLPVCIHLAKCPIISVTGQKEPQVPLSGLAAWYFCSIQVISRHHQGTPETPQENLTLRGLRKALNRVPIDAGRGVILSADYLRYETL